MHGPAMFGIVPGTMSETYYKIIDGKKFDKQMLEIAEQTTAGKGDGAARETGSVVVALLRLGGKVENQDAVLKALRAGQRSDGGFGKEGAKESDLESSYRILRCFHMLKSKPEAPDKLRAFVATCRNRDGGYGAAPGQPSTVAGTYFASIVLHWLDEK